MAELIEEKSDGLEILSIGKLYTGSWDKKYWSSSRGKDRYPYPIGYNALRTQNGVSYKMEIHEGLNGPLFTISSTDGQSCSGQTPEIAWESFQKKGCQIKLLHGKRYSSKIDGVEFFGFKNTFVQRLLRELVANISGTPELNFLSSTSLRNETSEAVNQTELTGSKTDPNLLTHMEKPQSAGKRNRKGRTNNVNAAANTSLRKPRCQNKSSNIKALNYGQQEYGEHPPPFSSNTGSYNGSETLQESETLQTINEREKVLLPVVESFDKDDHLLSSMENPRSAGKRNRKGRTNNIKSAANTSLKKPRCQNKSSDIKALYSGQQEYGEHLPPCSSNKGSCDSSEALQESETLQTINEREKVLVPVVESFDKDDHIKVDSVSSEGGRQHLNPHTVLPLEELVANISGTPEQNLLSSIPLRNVTSEALNLTELTGSKADPNLLTHLVKFQSAGKRNSKGRTNNIKSAANICLKRARRQNKSSNIKALNSSQQEYGEHPPPFSSSKGSCSSSEVLQESESLQTIIKREKVLVPVVESFDKDDHLKVDSDSSQGGRKHLNHETEKPLEYTELLEDGKLFDRSKVLDEQVMKNQMAEKEGRESPVENGTQRINDANLWAPDTLDHPPNDYFSLTAEIVKEAAATVSIAVPDSLIIDSHPESEMGTSRSEVNSQKSESDSAGHEIANSMMTFLLPQALPLLRTYSRKKKNDIKSPEMPIHNSQDKTKKINLHLDSISVSKLDENSLLRQKENTKFPVCGCVPTSTACFLAEAFVPDSFDNSEGGYTPSQGLAQILQVAEGAKEDQTVRGLQTYRPEIVGPSKNDIEAVACNVETGTERENDFLPSTHKLTQVSRKEASGTQRAGAIVSGSLTNVPPSAESMVQHVSLSKSVLCRDFRDDSVTESNADINAMHTSHFLQESSSKQGQTEQSISTDEPHIDGQPHNFDTKERFPSTSATPFNLAPRSQDQGMDQISDHIQTSRFLDSTATNSEINLSEMLSRDQQCVGFTVPLLDKQNQKIDFSADTADGTEKKENHGNVNMEAPKDLKTESGRSGILKVIAGYAHPMPISSVLLTTQENDLYICVLCGQPLHEERTIFMYKAPMEGEEKGCPSFIGQVSIQFQFSDGAFLGDIELDSAAVQLTPIGQSLVLFNGVRAPSCSEGDIKCQCTSCALNLFEENAVKIVQIRNGYLSLITKLKTTLRVCCILVCPPDHLVAVEESGKLYVWVMNSKWRAETEKCCLLPPDCPPFSSTKLKRIPNFASLVLGYNGFGEFSIWDIKKCLLVSKFSAASTSVFQCLPVSLFRWQRKFTIPAGVTEEIINEITDVTKTSFLEISDNQPFCLLEDKDVAIWVLISTAPDSNFSAYQSSEQQSDPFHCWRLALLVNNTMIMGNSLDPRATAVGFSAGHGIIGRSDGLVYMWELTTGKKLQNLHHFKDAAVSSIVSDDSSHRAVAIASNGGQLLVYLPS